MKRSILVKGVLFAASLVSLAYAEPNVQITKPVNNQPVTGPINVVAQPINGHVLQRVDFYIDGLYGTPVASVKQAPFRFRLDPSNLSEGSHGIGANAFDSAGKSFFTYNIFYVVRSSSSVRRCADTIFLVKNLTDQPLGGGIEGTRGDMGSGGWSVPAGGVTYFDLPTVPRTTGDYGVHVVASVVNVPESTVGAEAVIPNIDGCPRTGVNAVVTLREKKKDSSLKMNIDVR